MDKNNLNTQIAQLRKEYTAQQLTEENVNKSPFIQFEKWFYEAMNVYSFDANAMMLSTVSKEGNPSSRIVLLKSFDETGFTFFTNYHNNKGRNIEQNYFVSLSFFWMLIERQVHINGIAKKISNEASDDYFASRPFESQIGAWASKQSQKIENRAVIDEKYMALKKQYENKTVPRPPYWGGFLVEPSSIEFWQGRASRLHDRILFEKYENNEWGISRLSP